MRIIDILRSPECSDIFSEVNEFVRNNLKEYNDIIERDGFSFQDKDVFDFVWGTVEMSAAEICVLDSPLLQRLRRIRQLGMASTVYCNADHSRFSHTIGVLEVSGRMASVITKKLKTEIGATYNFQEIVRFAALFHDTGHMFFSHVSEIYFTYDPSFVRHEEITKAKSFFCEKTSSTTLLHELLSVMIVNSNEVIRLIKIISKYALKSKFPKEEYCEQFIEYISCLIIGVPVDKSILPYSMIINSAIDADKLDYLYRDSACTKVPIAVDIARIIQKLDVVYIDQKPNTQIWNDYTGDSTPLSLMAIKNSAKKVFWQLSIARSMMYESVYYHHKVLTAETMFRMALLRIYRDFASNRLKFFDMLKITDDYFGEYFADILVDEPFRTGENCNAAAKILDMIRNRNLFKRVASFSRDSINAPLEVSRGFIMKVIKSPLSLEFNKFYIEMVKEYKEIRRILAKPDIEGSPIFMFIEVFFDDGAYSGKQVISIFQEYMGIEKEQRSTNEHHVDKLSEENMQKLRQTNIVLAYLCFNPESLSYIQGEMKKLGIKNVDVIYINDLSIKIFDSGFGIFKDDIQRDLLRKCLYDIGRKILISRNQLGDGAFKDRWSMERIENSSLGYNDAQQMVVFEQNIPTYTISAFWTRPEDDEAVWKGLFQRTLKD
ncbi:MAG: HD domain-containing protein [Ruminiclostridium sp.]|nr:HD domain-containing protein [Ruminiclostridium sp.]